MQDSKTSDEELYRAGSHEVYNVDLDDKLHFVCSSVFVTAYPGHSVEKIMKDILEIEDADDAMKKKVGSICIGQPGESDLGRGAGMDY